MTIDASEAPWVDAVRRGDEVRPTVLLLGGFLAFPPFYGPLAGRLRRRGAADVVVANVWTPDWLLATGRGLGPILTRAGRGLLEASRRSEASPFSLGAPVLLVGHSMGGMLARLLTSPVPVEGRKLAAAGRVGAIATLGTPHVVSPTGRLRRAFAARAAATAERDVPGAWFAPGTGYLAVASRRTVGRRDGTRAERAAWRAYRAFCTDPVPDEIAGDALIPVESALLRDAPGLLLDGAAHGGAPLQEWYGSERFVDVWWPRAVEAWEAALRARADLTIR